jgi:hypothetical protein
MGFLFFLKRAGYFVLDHWKIFAIAVVVIVFVVLFYKACSGKKPVKIDLETVQKVNSADRREREAELQKVIEENSDVISTVDNRSAIAETNVVERNREIDARVKEADRKIEEAKRQGRDVTSEELECILVPENCQ